MAVREAGRTGAHLVARCLAAAGIHRIFSLSGNQILSLYDALLDEGIAIVHTRHEGAAVHAADAWARVTGLPGICLVTAGSGHGNAIGALAMAEAANRRWFCSTGTRRFSTPGRGRLPGEGPRRGWAPPITRWVEKPPALPKNLPDLVCEEVLPRTFRAGRAR